MNMTPEEKLSLKRALMQEFRLTEKRVSKAWVDAVDCNPNKDNADDWDYLLVDPDGHYYVNLKFLPRITIEPIHTTNYDIGIVKYTGDVDFVIAYFHNILDKDDD